MNIYQIKNTFNWFLQTDSHLSQYSSNLFQSWYASMVVENLKLIANDIEKEQLYFSRRLYSLSDILFANNFKGCCSINPFVFGQIFEILLALLNNNDIDQWRLIHPRIAKASKSLYLDGHYANAAEDAFIEINERVKKLFQILRPQDNVPDGDTAMTTVFSANKPIIMFCNNSAETGKNIQKGFMQMLSGAMSALRNPKAHANITLTADDAMRQLMFASMLMYKIDEAVNYSKIQEWQMKDLITLK